MPLRADTDKIKEILSSSPTHKDILKELTFSKLHIRAQSSSDKALTTAFPDIAERLWRMSKVRGVVGKSTKKLLQGGIKKSIVKKQRARFLSAINQYILSTPRITEGAAQNSYLEVQVLRKDKTPIS